MSEFTDNQAKIEQRLNHAGETADLIRYAIDHVASPTPEFAQEMSDRLVSATNTRDFWHTILGNMVE